tara:strand:- start:1221 stop:1481 length:261 start_codon:yes stop_codon:yes gene_type:complete
LIDKRLKFRYIFEIIIIVFSITFSFYIQEILNDREKIELKNESLKGVISDLRQDKQNFNQGANVIYYRIGLIENVLEGNFTNKNIS